MRQALFVLYILLCIQHIICMDLDSPEYKAIVEKAQECQCSPLAVACINEQTNIVEYLLTQKTTDINASDPEDNTPLHGACYEGYADCISLLVQSQGIHCNAPNKHGLTPLLMAYARLHTKAIDILLSRKDLDLWQQLPKVITAEQKGLQENDTIVRLVLADYKQVITDAYVLNAMVSPEALGRPMIFVCERFSIGQKDVECCKEKALKIEKILYSFLRFIVLHQQYSHSSVKQLFSDYKKQYERLETLIPGALPRRPMEEKAVLQEKAVYHIIRKNLNKKPCALFFAICDIIGAKNTHARFLIARYYYELNKEVIAAQLYRHDPYYFILPKAERIVVKEQLHKNPKSFYLLWHNGRKKHHRKAPTAKK